ncbi:MAG TPA: hypothetical protein VJH23_01490 [archaeon]|nr:hypothetical protein [archaeon]
MGEFQKGLSLLKNVYAFFAFFLILVLLAQSLGLYQPSAYVETFYINAIFFAILPMLVACAIGYKTRFSILVITAIAEVLVLVTLLWNFFGNNSFLAFSSLLNILLTIFLLSGTLLCLWYFKQLKKFTDTNIANTKKMDEVETKLKIGVIVVLLPVVIFILATIIGIPVSQEINSLVSGILSVIGVLP